MLFLTGKSPVKTKHPKLGELSIEVETPQVETIEEATQWHGGVEKLLEFLNGQYDTNAKNGSRAYLRGIEVKDGDDTNELIVKGYKKAKEIAKEYTPSSGSREPSLQRKQASAFSQIAALANSGKELTQEELLAIIANVGV